jgi:hypothetical protein
MIRDPIGDQLLTPQREETAKAVVDIVRRES